MCTGEAPALVQAVSARRTDIQAAAEHPAFAPGASLAVRLNGREIGVLGAVSAKMRHPYRMTSQMALCEMRLAPLLARYSATGRISPVPQFPAVRRDIAVVAAPGVANADIEKTVRKNGSGILTGLSLFDIFKGKGMKDGGRSLGYSLEFRSCEKTLTDAEVGEAFRKVVDALKAMPGVEVRES